MSKQLKTLLLSLGILGVIAAAVFVVYTVNKPTPTPVSMPSPKASIPSPSPVTPQVFEVNTGTSACVTTFTVAEDLTPGLNCESKELYKDVAANTAGHYTLSGNKLADGFTLIPGDTYVYVLNYKNSGTAEVAGTLTDVLPSGLTYMDSTDGCTYASSSRTVTCTVTSTAASGTGYAAVRFSVDEPATLKTITNSAKLTPALGNASTCAITNPIKTPTPSASPNPSVSPSPSGSPAPSPSVTTAGNLDCVVKRAYEDNTSNSAGKYYLNDEIVDTASLIDGETVVYNVAIRNTGNADVNETKITDILSSNLTFMDGESGCTYDSNSRTVTCSVGTLAANTETSRSFRARIGVAGTTAIANTADVTSSNGQRDSCSITINAAGKVVQQPSPVPTSLPEAGIFEVTAGTLGIGVILLLLGTIGLLLI